ncbi:hypothetical protein B0H10DRAFT_2195727 [Mycena sp. CBHHK59/15]|nr:hypothetical protein B0H10DRAFT_2195727 [Mycena sp. CBHHK59/15]
MTSKQSIVYYSMRRESADNDSLAYLFPDSDFCDYIPIKSVVPWSLGPTGELSDRVFAQVAIDCPVRRSVPSRLCFPSRSLSESSEPPASPTAILAHFHAVVASIDAKTDSVSASTDPEAEMASAESEGTYLDLDDFASSCDTEDGDWRSLKIGDFVILVCDLSREDCPHDGAFVRVYTINTLSLTIVA